MNPHESALTTGITHNAVALGPCRACGKRGRLRFAYGGPGEDDILVCVTTCGPELDIEKKAEQERQRKEIPAASNWACGD